MTPQERKEIAAAVVAELKASDRGDCRLFTRDEAQDLREFAKHWRDHSEDYHGLVEMGKSWQGLKRKAGATAIGMLVVLLLTAVGLGIAEKLKREFGL